jgi:hypothetical protein
VVALVGGALALSDRYRSDEPRFRGELSSEAKAVDFVEFAARHDGDPVELDLTCDGSGSCLVEGVADLVLVWAFENGRCFEDSNESAVSSCRGATAFWISRGSDSDAVVTNGASGAGSIQVRGRFVVRDAGMGGAVFPGNIHNVGLTAVGASDS